MRRMKMMFVLAAAAVCLAGSASAGYAEEAAITGSFEEGKYVVRIPDTDMGWFAEDMIEDESVVTLGSAELVDGDFILQFEPAADGQTTVGARHFYNAFACDEVHTWDLKVEGGEIKR